MRRRHSQPLLRKSILHTHPAVFEKLPPEKLLYGQGGPTPGRLPSSAASPAFIQQLLWKLHLCFQNSYATHSPSSTEGLQHTWAPSCLSLLTESWKNSIGAATDPASGKLLSQSSSAAWAGRRGQRLPANVTSGMVLISLLGKGWKGVTMGNQSSILHFLVMEKNT